MYITISTILTCIVTAGGYQGNPLVPPLRPVPINIIIAKYEFLLVTVSPDQSESLPLSTVGGMGEEDYDLSITNYHPFNHACWNKGKNVLRYNRFVSLLCYEYVFHKYTSLNLICRFFSRTWLWLRCVSVLRRRASV